MKPKSTHNNLLVSVSILLFALPQWSMAQLSVNSSYTAQQLVEDFFIGQGVQVTNVTLGAQTMVSQLGAFNNTNTNLDISNGIMLSTGYATDASIAGTNINNSFSSTASGCTSAGLCLAGDADLNAIVGTTTKDAAVLEFDFIPLSDTIRFRYVFASEEYNEFVCSQFNDVFAFLLTGPGHNNQNIARIPNTNIPVAINTVNSGNVGINGSISNCSGSNGSLSYSNLFVNNLGGQFLQFDGMTTVLEAMAVVQPCQSYHIKLAIADAVDGALDSGVFLEANSFTAGLPQISVSTSANDSTIIEGCDSGSIVLSYDFPLDATQTFTYNVLGTATMGVDFNSLSGVVTIPSGQSSATININPISDAIQEGTETVILEIQTATCYTDTITVFIRDENILSAPTIVCDTANAVSITYSWDSIVDAEGYRVSSDSGQTWDTLAPTILQYSIYGLTTASNVPLIIQTIGGLNVCNENPMDTINCSTLSCNLSGSVSGIVNTTCFGGNDGEATISPINGKAPFEYVLDGVFTQNNGFFNNLTAGNHIITIIDTDSCMHDIQFSVGEPNEIIVSIDSVFASSCHNSIDGAVQLSASDGVGNYTYSLFGNTNTTGFFDNLSAGTYPVFITDDNGCVKIDSFTITAPSPIVIAPFSTIANCANEASGSAFVNVSGGTVTSDYQYLWNNNQTTSAINNVFAGIYSITVTDDNNCSDSTSIPINEPTPISFFNVLSTPTSCFGGNDGTLSVSNIGGTGNYQYLWNTGDPMASLTNLQAGDYTVTVTDGNGCEDSLTVAVTQPDEFLITSIDIQHIICNGATNGTATAETNDKGFVHYLWQPSFQITQTAVGLDAGLYEISAINPSGCIAKDTIEIQEPAAISSIFQEIQPASCNKSSDGISQVLVSGGTPFYDGSYQYFWNTTPIQTTSTASNLTGGDDYIVTITDSLGCVSSDTVSINQPLPIGINTIISDVKCFGDNNGQIQTNISGGTPPYQYQWSNNATTQNLQQLPEGTYFLTVTDLYNCEKITDIEVSQPSIISLNTDKEDVLCKDEATGKVNVTIAGGTPPYQILWNDSQTSTTIQNLLAGLYQATITDSNQCEEMTAIQIEEPPSTVALTFQQRDITCFGGRDGQISIQANGGTPPHQYSTDGVQFTNANILIGLTAGDYITTVQDDNGCIVDTITSISEPAEMTIHAGEDKLIIYGDRISLPTVARNAQPPVIYQWTPPDALSCTDCPAPVANPLVDAFYNVLITDNRGCTAEDRVTVRIQKERNVGVATGFTPNGDGVNDYLFLQAKEDIVQVITLFRVYDRWGELVFETKDIQANTPSDGWNGQFQGKVLGSGVYGWYAEVIFNDGEKGVFKGNSTLVR